MWWPSSWWLTAMYIKCQINTIILWLYSRNIQKQRLDLCVCCVFEEWDKKGHHKDETVGLHLDRGDRGWTKRRPVPFSVPASTAIGLWCCQASLSFRNFTLMMAMTSRQRPSHPGVPFLTQRVQHPRTHALPKANMRHPSQCGLWQFGDVYLLCHVDQEWWCSQGDKAWGFGLGGEWVGLRGLEVSDEELKKGETAHNEELVFLKTL